MPVSAQSETQFIKAQAKESMIYSSRQYATPRLKRKRAVWGGQGGAGGGEAGDPGRQGV